MLYLRHLSIGILSRAINRKTNHITVAKAASLVTIDASLQYWSKHSYSLRYIINYVSKRENDLRILQFFDIFTWRVPLQVIPFKHIQLLCVICWVINHSLSVSCKKINPRSWFDLLYNWPPNSDLLLNKSLLELIYFLIKTLQCAICYLLHIFSADNVIISCVGSCWWYIVREHISRAGSMVSVHWIRHMLSALRVSNLPCDVLLSWYFVLLFHINCKLPVNVLLS